ncbi:MAG: hypothetical protein J0H08_11150 [Rhizobiales bacterium]|nr:hypothetical protein [Hyphomicrobiales bacterium]
MQRIYIANAGWTNMSWGTRIMAVLGATLGLALAVGFVVLSLGIALLLLPVVAVFAAVGWWRWRKIAADLRRQQAEQPAGAVQPGGFRVIDVDYEVVEPGERRRS